MKSYYGSGGGGGVGGGRSYDYRRGGGGPDERKGFGRGRGRGGGRYDDRSRSRDRCAGGGGGGDRDTLQIITNLYKLEIRDTTNDPNKEWYMYHVDIYDAINKNIYKDDGTTLLERKVVKKINRKTETEMTVNISKSTALSRRILQNLQNPNNTNSGEPLCFVSDGGSLLYSPHRLFEPPPEQDEEEKGKRQPHEQERELPPSKEFAVKVKKNCDDDDEMADRVKNVWYIVKLTEVGTIDPNVIREEQVRIDLIKKFIHSVNSMFKDMMMKVMIADGKNPNMFYFKQNDRTMLGNNLAGSTNDRLPYEPNVGLMQTLRYVESGNVYVHADFSIGWFNKETTGQGQKIPLLNENNSKICGVSVNLHQVIGSDRVQKEIKEALKRHPFHVEYLRTLDEKFIQTLKQEGKSDKEIQKKRKMVRRNVMLQKSTEDYPDIYWNPEDYKFKMRKRKPIKQEEGAAEADGEGDDEDDGPEYTVASYFLERYGIRLKFPRMPIVKTTMTFPIEYYPVEFLFQAKGKLKGANSSDFVQKVLKFNDEFFSTKRIEHTSGLRERCERLERITGQPIATMLRQFNLQVRKDPLTITARKLSVPQLRFKNQQANINNGSWNLRGVEFQSNADLRSFAVIDLAQDQFKFNEFLLKLLEVLRKHGVSLSESISLPEELVSPRALLSELKVVSPTNYRSSVMNLDYTGLCKNFREAIDKAKRVFMSGGLLPFRTNVKQPGQDKLLDVFVFASIHGCGAIPEADLCWETHWVTNPKNNQESPARLMYEIKVPGSGEIVHADPYEIRFNPRNRQLEYYRKANKAWCPADFRFCRRVYNVNKESPFHVPEIEVAPNPRPACPVADDDIECPALVIVYLPGGGGNQNQLYNACKLISNFEFGVQCQCIVDASVNKQRGLDQYCSNVALKINTKLYSSLNNAAAWKVTVDGKPGVPWVNEVPTLVMGFTMSHGLGQDSNSVVAATICLSPDGIQMAQELRLQKKQDFVSGTLMRHITMSFGTQFFFVNGVKPLRVLIYRDGGSDGQFDELIQREIAAIRQGFCDLDKAANEYNCENQKCQGKGCAFCTPSITFVIAQSQHNIKIVPAMKPPPGSRENGNVPSGTCVDDNELLSNRQLVQLSEENIVDRDAAIPEGCNVELFEIEGSEDGCSDFFLTAQGGLKGTSKAVYYKTIMNENYIWKTKGTGASSLTGEKLRQLTFVMSHLYGTATKATRAIPVIHYSKRLAETAIGYTKHLIDQGKINYHEQNEEKFYCSANVPFDGENAQSTQILQRFGPFYGMPFRPHLSA